jgi:hypothetical protein
MPHLWCDLDLATILTAVFGVFLGARRAVRSHQRRRFARAAIAARADYEHPAIMRGDGWLGTFGQYRPAPWWQ